MKKIVRDVINSSQFEMSDQRKELTAKLTAFALAYAGVLDGQFGNISFKNELGHGEGTSQGQDIEIAKRFLLDREDKGLDMLALWHEIGHALDDAKAQNSPTYEIYQSYDANEIGYFVNLVQELLFNNQRYDDGVLISSICEEYLNSRYALCPNELRADNFSFAVADCFENIGKQLKLNYDEKIKFKKILEQIEYEKDLLNSARENFEKVADEYKGKVIGYSREVLTRLLSPDQDGNRPIDNYEDIKKVKVLVALSVACRQVFNETQVSIILDEIIGLFNCFKNTCSDPNCNITDKEIKGLKKLSVRLLGAFESIILASPMDLRFSDWKFVQEEFESQEVEFILSERKNVFGKEM